MIVFKKYIKIPFMALLLAIIGLFTLNFTNVNANTAGIPNYEFLPSGTQYLSNDHFEYLNLDRFHAIGSLSGTTYKIKVKPNTTYMLGAAYLERYWEPSVFVLNSGILEFNKSKDFIRDTPAEFDDEYSSESYKFTTTAETHYIVIEDLEYTHNNIREFTNQGSEKYNVDQLIILYESENIEYNNDSNNNLIVNVDFIYRGPLIDKTPVLTGETAFVTNVDNPMTVSEILTHISAIDAEDGDITHKIVVDRDTYTSNNKTLGTYEIDLSVTDNADNRAVLKVYVLVKDATAPVITGPKTVNANITTLKNVAEIQALLSVSDNYDKSGLVIKIDSNQYQGNYNKVGSWPIVFSATDSSGNKGTHTVNVVVIDNVPPVISGPKTILKNQTETLTLSEIKSQLTANDNVDGNITSSIFVVDDNFTGNGHKVGKFTIKFAVTDNAGNRTEHAVEITVKDNVPPVFYVDNFFINVSQSLILTNDDIKNLLLATGQIVDSGNTIMSFLVNEYAGNESQIGIYALQIATRSNTGREDIINLAVKVNEDTNKDGDIIIKEATTFEKVMEFVIDNWYWYLFGLIGIYLIRKLFGRKFRRRYRKW